MKTLFNLNYVLQLQSFGEDVMEKIRLQEPFWVSTPYLRNLLDGRLILIYKLCHYMVVSNYLDLILCSFPVELEKGRTEIRKGAGK